MTRFGALIFASLGAGLIGCGDRMMTEDYQGESLLRLRGSVAIPLALQGSVYEPAIGWWSVPKSGEVGFPYMRINRVDVAGDFPANFTIDVFDPPPEESLLNDEDAGEPAYAEGVITAVAPYFPSAVNLDWLPNGCGDGCHLHSICEGTNAPASPESDRSECFQQQFQCRPELVTNPDENGCELQGTGGNQSLAFGGASNELRIVYFNAPIAADTLLAERFNDAEPIAAGYHLYRLPPNTPSVIENADDYVPAEFEKCAQKALQLGYEMYNREHGTNFTDEPMTPQPQGAAYHDFERTVLRAKRQLDCPRPGIGYKEIDTAAEGIAIQLGMISASGVGF